MNIYVCNITGDKKMMDTQFRIEVALGSREEDIIAIGTLKVLVTDNISFLKLNNG